MEIRDEKFDSWIKNNLNVLFVGRQGVGKTTRVLQAFKRAGLSYRYFSGSTIDPWIDFIGVPKSNGQYLEFVLPKGFADDSIQAIFIDEFNRSHKKIRNAVMELIQFKSINGRPFKNLKMVWAAINPEDEDEFQVEPLDPAQKDRFHVHVYMPYEPSRSYFNDKYGPETTKSALHWWKELNEDQQKLVSPRRLDYALEINSMPGGDMHDVLPPSCNVSKLSSILRSGPINDRLAQLFKDRDHEETQKFLNQENNFAAAQKFLLTTGVPSDKIVSEWLNFFLPTLTSEKLTCIVAGHEKTLSFILEHIDHHEQYRNVVQSILEAHQNRKLVRKIKKVLGSNKTLIAQYASLRNVNVEPSYFSKNKNNSVWTNILVHLRTETMDTTPQRMKVYGTIHNNLPPTLTTQQAVDTLEVLNMIVDRCWANTTKKFKDLMGIVNHCVSEIYNNQQLLWPDILKKYGQKFEKLLSRIKEAKLDDKLLCPSIKTCDMDGTIVRHDFPRSY